MKMRSDLEGVVEYICFMNVKTACLKKSCAVW